MTTPIGPAADTPDRAQRRGWLEEQGEAAAARGHVRQSWLFHCEWFTLLPLAVLDDELRSYAEELGIATRVTRGMSGSRNCSSASSRPTTTTLEDA